MRLIDRGGEKVTSSEFEKIYCEYFDGVYRYLLGLSGNRYIAEEMTSDTFFKAMQGIDNFKGNCQMKSWLCQIARNTYYSYLRKSKNVNLVNEIPETENAEEKSIEEQILKKDTSMKIHSVLHYLEEPYKEVFTLRVFGELSFNEIGRIFEKTENWACVTYYRARKKIQERMEEIQ